ncbi:MAG: metal ABC transporter substrate-binding protein [Lentisphaeraceae bacterium]|nr:metal ABC transporter substrate-binding protein [Lentisphaeraceae bacterium]
MKSILILFLSFIFSISAKDKLNICVTVTDLAALTEAVGGNFVEVTTFAPAKGNPHNVIAKPSFIKLLSKADLFIQVGFDLEAGWVPPLLKNCRNENLQPGQKGHLNPSNVIRPLFEKKGRLTRADGHIHPFGNPHYLMDPVNGLIVAHLITNRLKVLQPENVSYFNERLNNFQQKLIERLIGNKLAAKYPMKKMSMLIRRGKLNQFLELSKQENSLGGWLRTIKQHKNRRFIADHANYIYLINRFEMEVIDYLEPKPGMTPTTSHLMGLTKSLKNEKVQGILVNSYFPAKYAKLLSSKANLPIIKLAHQVGSRPGCETYLKMIAYNVDQVSKVLNE